MEDTEIIKLFLARDEEAITEIRKKYGRLCYNVAFNILHNAEDAEECVGDVYIELWSIIPPEPRDLKAFVCRVAKNLSITRLKYNLAQKRSSDHKISLSGTEEIFADGSMEENAESKEIGEAISRFLRSQSPVQRNVFIRRYWFMDTVKDIAARYSFSAEKVKSMLFHTRRKLKKFLKEEGIEI